ncbi:MAG: ATP-binding protein [Spirochaetes bacterium]|nr:ATP-binding protein [Spirochaetota bacterium]
MQHAIAKLLIPTAPTLLSILGLSVLEIFLRLRGVGYDTLGPLLLFGIVFSTVFVEGIQGYYTAIGISLVSALIAGSEEQGAIKIFGLTTLGVTFCIARLKYLRYKAILQSERAEVLYRLSRDLTRKNGKLALLASAASILKREVPDTLEFYLVEGNQILKLKGTELDPVDEHLRTLPDWVFRTGEPAGKGTETLPGADALFLPLGTDQKRFGALSVQFRDPADYYDEDKRSVYETIAKQIGEALERDQEVVNGFQTNLVQEGEKLRNSLLRSLSHDLRTPLTGIQGSIELLKMKLNEGDTPENRELLESVSEELAWLARMMDNILSLTRFESERVVLRKESESVEDVVGSAVRVLSKRLASHPLHIKLPDSILMVPMESALIEQVLVNLLDNAAKYSNPNAPIEIEVGVEGDMAVFKVADRGIGIALEDLTRVFEKFQRGKPEEIRGIRGTGLGLSICKAIIEAHGGTIQAIPREGGGTIFRFTLPLEVETNG